MWVQRYEKYLTYANVFSEKFSLIFYCHIKKKSYLCTSKCTLMRYNPNLHQYDTYAVKENTTLMEWLMANLQGSKSKIKATLSGRGVKVNNVVVTQFDYELHVGDKIAISKTKQNDVFHSKFLKIVYEDRWIIVIDKSVGILSMAASHSALNVKVILDEYFLKTRQGCRAHVVHRLDRDTSGLMVYAKNIEVEQILEHNWHDIVYERRYVAVVSGVMKQNEGTVANWLKDNKAYVTYSSPTDNGGKYAVTHFKTLNRSKNYSLVDYKLETGRKNQIRVHSADMGYPVCGDEKYGNGDNPLRRLCLHAYMLCFHHPITHEAMEFQTPIPASFRQLFE